MGTEVLVLCYRRLLNAKPDVNKVCFFIADVFFRCGKTACVADVSERIGLAKFCFCENSSWFLARRAA